MKFSELTNKQKETVKKHYEACILDRTMKCSSEHKNIEEFWEAHKEMDYPEWLHGGKKRVVFLCPECLTLTQKVYEFWRVPSADECVGNDYGEILRDKTDDVNCDIDCDFVYTMFDGCSHTAVIGAEQYALLIFPDGTWKHHPDSYGSLVKDLSLSRTEINAVVKKFIKQNKDLWK